MDKKEYYCMRYYVTYRCNSRCRYCNVWQEGRFQGVKELKLEEAKNLIAQCYQAGVRYIDFTGGEPTLNPNLAELLKYARSLGIKTEVTTNGISPMPGKLQEIACCADKFNLSLDTLRPDAYAKIRGIDGLDKVLETVEKLMPIRQPKIMAVISQDNLSELDDMIGFARQHHAEIYLNPVFSYFDTAGNGESEAAIAVMRQIVSKLFEPYTVVMLHFMEFLQNLGAEGRPLCSANSRTLTFAPDGALMLPCYHKVEKTIPWNGNLEKMLAADSFKRYACADFRRQCSGSCSVIPYFGISFNYRLDAYFLIQSYSEKLNHLKRDYLNHIPGLKTDGEGLHSHLAELLSIIRSLKINQEREFTGLYWAEKGPQGYCTDVYRDPLDEEQYLQERAAKDCWELKMVPHYEFDKAVNRFYKRAYAVWQDVPYQGDGDEAGKKKMDEHCLNGYQVSIRRKEALGILGNAMEFQLRLWKFYISRYMNVSVVCRCEEERVWLEKYGERMLEWEKLADMQL